MGNYYVKLDGQVDALVFAGGIGEKGASLRASIIERCRCLGCERDSAKNERPAENVVADIGTPRAPRRALVCRTDEQVRCGSSRGMRVNTG